MNKKGKQPVLFIVGPTAVGKTSLSLEIAKDLDGEIINADSMQIYCGMDVGTGKPTKAEQNLVPHHLFDIVEPSMPFDVVKYQKLAQKTILEVLSRKRVPIVVGGTGLYVNSLVYDMEFVAAGKDEEYRKELEQLASIQGKAAVFELLKSKNPETAAGLHPNDLFRVIRALELAKCGELGQERRMKREIKNQLFRPCVVVLSCKERARLYAKIDSRVDAMIAGGLPDEAGRLFKTLGPTAAQAIGYKEFAGLFEGKLSLDEVTELIKKNSRHYAKRQLTWFCKMPGAKILEEPSAAKVLEIWREFLCDV